MKIKVKKMSENTILPERKTSGAAGFDLFLPENIRINANSATKVKSGVFVNIDSVVLEECNVSTEEKG